MNFTVYGPKSFIGYFDNNSSWGKELEDILNQFKTVDTTRYDIVEKKDYKLKRLKEQIEREENYIKGCKDVIDKYAGEVKRAQEKIKKYKEELIELTK